MRAWINVIDARAGSNRVKAQRRSRTHTGKEIQGIILRRPGGIMSRPLSTISAEATIEMNEVLKQNLTRSETWLRVLYVILFALIYTVAEIVLAAVVVVQFGFVLITGQRNPNLLEFGASLSRFMYDVLRYFTFLSDDRPFPFQPWPGP